MGTTHDGVYTGGSTETESETRHYPSSRRVKIPLTKEEEQDQQRRDNSELKYIEYERKRATTDARREQLDRYEHRIRGRKRFEDPSN